DGAGSPGRPTPFGDGVPSGRVSAASPAAGAVAGRPRRAVSALAIKGPTTIDGLVPDGSRSEISMRSGLTRAWPGGRSSGSETVITRTVRTVVPYSRRAA